MGNTVKLHRVLATTPEKLYRAFIEPEALSRWIAPDGFTCVVHSLEPKVGGKFKMSFTNFTTHTLHSFGGEYLELVPNQLLKYTDKFDDPNLPDKIVVTVTMKQVSCGTELNIIQENIPVLIPVENCYMGWQQSLQYLAKLVEPDIKG
jgi:uncharacterized protein YndB with AHSA1/START domain